MTTYNKCGTDERYRGGKCKSADHDHKTGKFRAHIYHPCNIALSHVEKYGLERGPQINLYLSSFYEKP